MTGRLVILVITLLAAFAAAVAWINMRGEAAIPADAAPHALEQPDMNPHLAAGIAEHDFHAVGDPKRSRIVRMHHQRRPHFPLHNRASLPDKRLAGAKESSPTSVSFTATT